MNNNVPDSLALTMIKNVNISKNSVHTQIQKMLQKYNYPDSRNKINCLLKSITLIDLTTLSGDDTRSNVFKLCYRAANPLSPKAAQYYDPKKEIRTAAVCVYPNRVPDAYKALETMGLLEEIHIASVATGFPSGLYPIESRLLEIKHAVANGATEIDVVLDRSLVLMGKWTVILNEVKQMKKACDTAHLKVILGAGELGSYENIYKASMISMMGGADFIKTSTGKEAVNATLPIGLVMCRAIRKFYGMTGIKVGLKPAGGIKTVSDTLNWLNLVYSELGPDWLIPNLFRIGASGLLDTLVSYLEKSIPNDADKNVKNVVN